LASSILLFTILTAAPQADRVSFRIITVTSEMKAAELRTRALSGESFEKLARENSTDPSAADGGFLGAFAPADLRQELRTALSGLAPGQISPVLKMGNEFVLLQLAVPGEVEWSNENATAMEGLQKGRYDEAARSFSRAVQLAEKFGADDDRLGQSLNGLAETYRLQEEFAKAGSIYRRILSIRWSAPSNKGGGGCRRSCGPICRSRQSCLLPRKAVRRSTEEIPGWVNKTPASESLYLAMSAILVKANSRPKLRTMQRAVRAFRPPAACAKEAEMHRDSGRMRQAPRNFQEASQMKAPAGMTPDRDRLQLSFIYQRMGGINTDLTQFDAAIAAYRKSLEISPENADDASRSATSIFAAANNRKRSPNMGACWQPMRTKPPHYRVADTNLQMGNFPEAAAAASRALESIPGCEKRAM
jgi:tetratricopeptide (TPR) repeat protein